ncbi:E3 ubiquitin/ISG15 ligase TRIM25 [Amia ocellicauda]|uniref:E3 ubiquitin/ISG15 ligase TRIM25 n=1 Tax=Amia ocellicauda TaxID=2972642 RepID=UPI0034646CE7
MSLSKPEQLFQDELSCPICLQLFSEPVLLPCGHNFCVSCIEGVIEQESGRGRHACPECRSEYRGRAALQRSFKLCNIVEGYKASQGSCDSGVLCDMCLENPLQAVKTCLKCEISLCTQHLKRHMDKKNFKSHTLVDPTADLSAMKCPLHDEALKYYCTDDQSSICVSCTVEGKHRNHSVKSFKTAQAELRAMLESQVKDITVKLRSTELLLQEGEERKAADHAEHTQLKQKAVGLLDHMVELVNSYRAQVIELIDTEQSLSEESLQGSMRQVAEQQELLKATQLQAQSVLAEQDEVVFVLKIQSIQSQTADATDKPLTELTAKPLDKQKVCRALNKEFRGTFGRVQSDLLQLFLSPLTFDPNTVHCNLLLSEDLRTVTYTATAQPYPEHPERFTEYEQVMCTQGFSSGEHSWEIETGECDWGVGVCYKSMKTKDKHYVSAVGYNEDSWGLQWYKRELSAYHDGKNNLHTATKPEKVKMCLNYEKGIISFYNSGDKPVHLHTFNTTFKDLVYPVVWIINPAPKAWITVKM